MKSKLGLLAFLPLMLVACGNSMTFDVDQNFSDNPPDVDGSYKLESTSCPNYLSDYVDVSQNKNNVILEGDDDTLKMSGKIDNDGDFEVKDEFGNSCNGHINSKGEVEAECVIEKTDCHAEYNRVIGAA